MESVLIVFQNAYAGREDEFDHWYTNVHIRDVMRLEGSVAVQRFIRSRHQPAPSGRRDLPHHQFFTVYETESARKCVRGHIDKVFTERMPVSSAGDPFEVFDYFFMPVAASRPWTARGGFRGEGDVLAARVCVDTGRESAFAAWFREQHMPEILAWRDYTSAALFTLHPTEQAMPKPAAYNYAAVYTATALPAAIAAWDGRFQRVEADGAYTLIPGVRAYVGCYAPRIPRLLAEDVRNPSPVEWAIDRQAREAIGDRRFNSMEEFLKAGEGPQSGGRVGLRS